MCKGLSYFLLIAVLVFLEIFIGSNTLFMRGTCKAQEAKPKILPIEGNITIFDVFDNYQLQNGLTTSWGFGCVIQTSTINILFDTGGDSSILLSNMEKMSINPKDIDIVVISHIHGDHLGGLEGFLEKDGDVKVFIPSSFPNSIRKKIKSYGSEYQDIKEAQKISESVYSSGEMGSTIKEQSLIIYTNKGMIIITGCAHPGIVSIIKKSKEVLDKEIYLVLGGFHLLGISKFDLENMVKDFKKLGVQKVAPSHCSGDLCREVFRHGYQDHYIEFGVGKILSIP